MSSYDPPGMEREMDRESSIQSRSIFLYENSLPEIVHIKKEIREFYLCHALIIYYQYFSFVSDLCFLGQCFVPNNFFLFFG